MSANDFIDSIRKRYAIEKLNVARVKSELD
jgi:hypothetical protein